MTTRRSGLSSTSPNALQRLVELAKTWNGESRDKGERVIQAKELEGVGRSLVRSGLINPANLPPDIGDIPDVSGYRTPPKPAGVSAEAAFRNALVSWGPPEYYGHAVAEVWRALSNDFSAAVLIATASGAVFSDSDVEGGTQYWYWIRFVNELGEQGPISDPATTTTAPDIDYLINELSDQISESELAQDLNSRIDLIDGPESLTGSVASRLKTEKTERTDADAALSQQITTIQAKANDNSTAIQTEQTARANADSALSSDITTLQTSVGDNSTAIQQQASTQDGLSAQYTVKIDNNGAVSGFGLASTPNDDTTDGSFSEFYVNADRFAVLPQGDSTSNAVAPFIVNDNSVYIDSAFIENGAITNAKIGTAAIDSAKISSITADKITTNDLSALSSDMGLITAGRIQSNDGNFIIDLNQKTIKITV